MSDPWLVERVAKNNELVGNGFAEITNEKQALEFEDNFTPSIPASTTEATQISNNHNERQPLPDSDTYLQGLERKLQRIKRGTNLVKDLSEKREDCMRTLLQNSEVCASNNNNNVELELDESINNGESTVQEIFRHLQPVQPISIGETVHIVKYDQLEQQNQALEQSEGDDSTEERDEKSVRTQ